VWQSHCQYIQHVLIFTSDSVRIRYFEFCDKKMKHEYCKTLTTKLVFSRDVCPVARRNRKRAVSYEGSLVDSLFAKRVCRFIFPHISRRLIGSCQHTISILLLRTPFYFRTQELFLSKFTRSPSSRWSSRVQANARFHRTRCTSWSTLDHFITVPY